MRVQFIRILTAIVFFSLSINNLSAQSIKSCGHDHAQTDQFDSPEEFQKAKSKVINGAYAEYLKRSGQKNNTTINIPVVVHVVHSGEPEGQGSNISDGRIQAQLDVLNEDFSATNANYSDSTRPEWDAVKGNPMISFCLATIDPNGGPTTGIERHDIEITGEDADNNNIEAVKASINWDSDLYMNIYVLSIPGTSAQGGVVGYAFLPYFGTVGQPKDGVVIDYNWFGGGNFGQSGDKTLTHEVGHYLGLFHTFYGATCMEDDGLGDTPTINDATSNLNPTLSCGNAMNPYPTGPTTCVDEHMYINYMDYVNDENCPTSYTIDQVAIMRGVLEGTVPAFASRANMVANAVTACVEAPTCDGTASIVTTAPSCNGLSDGTAMVSMTGGNAPYTYAWNTTPVLSTASISGLSSGTYFVTVTDDAGCIVVESAVVGSVETLSIIIQKQNESVRGAQDGSLIAGVSGGTPGYTLTWDQGLSSDSIQINLTPATYTLTVTDSNNCIESISATVSEGPCPTYLLNADPVVDVSCFGESNGQATITVVGQAGPFSYSWNGQSGANQRADLAAESYTIVATASNGCAGSTTVVISQPTVLGVALSGTDLTGNGASDGTATAAVTGGVAPYSYLWSNAAGDISSIDGLTPGTYSVTVSDANNCSVTEQVTINGFDCPTLDIDISEGALNCAGDNVQLTVASANGTAPYTYSWSTGATTATIAISQGGTYTASVVDANGCTASESVVLANAPEPLDITVSTFAESALNADDGRVVIGVEGGVAPYTYNWSNGASTSEIENLEPGVYALTVTDANNCSATRNATIREFTCETLSISLASDDITCHGAQDGSITGTTVGTGPYTYDWNDDATTEHRSALVAGTYRVTVTDGVGCEATASATIAEPEVLTVQSTVSQETFAGADDGQATLTIAGGVGDYTILWSDGGTTADRSGLAPGTYDYEVSDANNCSVAGDVTINEFFCPDLGLVVETYDNECSDGDVGGLDAMVFSGTAPFLYTIDSITYDSSSIRGLAGGVYELLVTDANGCTAGTSFGVHTPSVMSVADVTIEHVTGILPGAATIDIVGGVAPYTYLWSDGRTNATNNALFAGIHELQVTDARGCVLSQEVLVERRDDDNLTEGLQLFEAHPNPATENVVIDFAFSEVKSVRVVIANLSGLPLFTEVLSTDVYVRDVDVSSFAPGMYSINIYTDDEVINTPLVIF